MFSAGASDGLHQQDSPPKAAEAARKRPMRLIGIGFVWFGFFLLGFAVHQVFITGFLASAAQGNLESELASRSTPPVEVVSLSEAGVPGEAIEVAPPDFETLPGDDLLLPVFAPSETTVLYQESSPGRGEAVGRIRIPEIGVSWTAVEGVGRDQLKRGPGHMSPTPLPGEPGNAVVSGHRTTYGAPFRDLDQLGPGSVIHWDSPVLGTTTYKVTEVFVVRPDDVWVTDPRPGGWLTLTTCDPLYSSRQRLVVLASIVEGPNLAAIVMSS